MSRWTYAAIIILLGVSFLGISIVLLLLGYNELVNSYSMIIAPATALLIGIIGISFFGRESFLKEDRYHTLNVWFALGLVFFSLADITAILVYMNENSSEICFTIGLVQIPGLLLWMLGIVGYLKSLDSSLRLTEGTQLWLAIGIITTLASLSLIVIITILFPSRNVLSSIVSIPIIVVLGLIVCVIAGMFWIFKEGYISRPLLLLLFGVALLFVRSVFWQIQDFCEGNSLSQIAAIESYLILGASFLLASKLNVIFESDEE
ncbi:MAG: hypothetical protein ACFFEK_15355 [Candidatus Thorarchaeota archaeon]